ncbi:hypothetical protein [Nocardia sp. NPDC049526]|uniref:hypothetical protein n=1 Tax=Nocardia sp. NPDC049526 TaxID=3364316 RepID=UPI00378846A1
MEAATLVAPEQIAVAELPNRIVLGINTPGVIAELVAVPAEFAGCRGPSSHSTTRSGLRRRAINPGQVLDSARPRFHDFE